MIKATITYNKKTLTDLMKYNAVDKPWKWILYAVCTVLILVSFIANIGKDFFYFFLALFIFICIIDFLVIFTYFIFPKIKLKNFTEDNNIVNEFLFDEDKIKMTSSSKKRKGSSELKYSSVFKATETKNSFYLFVNKASALIVTKSELTDVTVDEFRAFLNEKITGKKVNKLKK